MRNEIIVKESVEDDIKLRLLSRTYNCIKVNNFIGSLVGVYGEVNSIYFECVAAILLFTSLFAEKFATMMNALIIDFK